MSYYFNKKSKARDIAYSDVPQGTPLKSVRSLGLLNSTPLFKVIIEDRPEELYLSLEEIGIDTPLTRKVG